MTRALHVAENIFGGAQRGRTLETKVFPPPNWFLESPFLEPLLRTLLTALSPSEPTARHLPRALLRTFPKQPREPF